MKISLWAVNLSHPVASLEAWRDLVEQKIIAAKSEGADILLMPEYAAEQWLHFAGKMIEPTRQLAWMAGHVPAACGHLKELAQKHDILLCAGTFPSDFEGSFANRAHIFFPDGRMIVQNKLCLTPKEKSPEGWMLRPGTELCIFEWRGCRICMLICLDIELPALSARIAQENTDLVLVPSMTKKLAGYHRVFDCAKARAVELQAAVAVVGAIGSGPGREPNISGASVFLPCEEKFGHTGVLAHIPPSYTAGGAGPLLTATLPVAEIRALRQGQAEVWPGAWTAGHVILSKSA